MSPAQRVIPAPGSLLTAEKFGESREYRVQTVTPVYGGGVTTGAIDNKFPVRASSVRGHLRFWWRLLWRQKYKTPEQLRQREFDVWGGPDFSSPVTVHVIPDQKSDTRSKSDSFGFDAYGPESYALFPAKNDDRENIKLLKEGFGFQLHVHWKDAEALAAARTAQNRQRAKAKQEPLPPIENIGPDVEAAIAAWLAWGGIGARTRRGLGSLQLKRGPALPALTDVLPPGCRLLAATLGKDANAMIGWHRALEAYQKFRQKEFRNPGSGSRPGRSRWPEPDSIRRMTGSWTKDKPHDHSQPTVTQSEPNFPKAALGLPIVFHYAQGPGQNQPALPDADPAGVELRPVDADRMSSPVITKPVLIGDTWHAGILILPHEHALTRDAHLVGTQARWDATRRQAVDLDEPVPAAQISGPQMKSLGRHSPLHSDENAVGAFVTYLKNAAQPRFSEQELS